MRADPAMMTASLLRSLSAMGVSSLVCPVAGAKPVKTLRPSWGGSNHDYNWMACKLLTDLKHAVDKTGLDRKAC